MHKPKLPVRFFRTSEGREPVRDWLKGLPDEERKAIGDDIRTEEREDAGSRPGNGEAAQAPVADRKGVKMARKKANPHVGSDFEDFLREEGRLEESTALAIKRVLAWEFQQAMAKADISQAEMARRMHTSRAVIRRLLDANDPSITLATISKAATVLGKNLRLKLAA